MSGEGEFHNWLRAQQSASPLVQLAAGDDLAVMRWPVDQLLLVGVDQVMEGVHFDSSRHSPRQIGAKAMNRNLSDCAAMACWPAAALVCVALPRNRGIEYAQELYLGIKEAGDKFNCPIVGGDTGTWDGPLVLSVSIFAKAEDRKVIRRGGAKLGDTIYVTGKLGGSLLGRHMNFVPRVCEAIEIAQSTRATAMIDLSDGLSRDLPRICQESHVGAMIESVRIPVHEDALAMSRSDNRSPLEHALHDGEDYELLFTGHDLENFGTPIGRIVSDPGVFLETNGSAKPLEPRGWEHQL